MQFLSIDLLKVEIKSVRFFGYNGFKNCGDLMY